MNDYGTFRRHFVALPLEVIMLAGAVLMWVEKDWPHMITALFTFVVSFTPLLFERVFRVRLPAVYQVGYVLFVFASMFLGEVAHFYWIRGWDATVHFISGILIGLGMVLWLRALLSNTKKFRLPQGMQLLFIVCFGIMVAFVWEIAEFTSDQVFGTTSQDGSLYDTMTDLIYGTTGVSLLAFLYGKYAKGRAVFGLTWAIKTFERFNP